MLFTLTKKERKENEKELLKFCKDNHCEMWNFMLLIKQIKNEKNGKRKMHNKIKS